MKYILLSALFITTQLFANYAISDEKTVKIDMHGGNTEKLTNSNRFSDVKSKGFGGLSTFGMKEEKKSTQLKKTIEKVKKTQEK